MKLSHYIIMNTTAIKLCVRQWAEEDRPCTRLLSLRRIRLNGYIIAIIPIVQLLETLNQKDDYEKENYQHYHSGAHRCTHRVGHSVRDYQLYG